MINRCTLYNRILISNNMDACQFIIEDGLYLITRYSASYKVFCNNGGSVGCCAGSRVVCGVVCGG